DAVALGVALLADIAERDHGLGEMEGGGIVQADTLGEVSKADALAVPRDLLEDGKGTAERLHAAARALFRLIVDGRLVRLHQPGNCRLAWRGRLFGGLLAGLFAALGPGARFHAVPLRLWHCRFVSGRFVGRMATGAPPRITVAYHNSN